MSDDYERVKKWCRDPREMVAPYNSICRVFEDYDSLRATAEAERNGRHSAEQRELAALAEADELRAELAALREQKPVAWRPGVDNRASYSHGIPSQRDHDYWKEIGVELELVYAAPVPAAVAVPDELVRDAERYQFQRNHLFRWYPLTGEWTWYVNAGTIGAKGTAESFEDAIDAAMLAAAQKEGKP